jgi:hypothetical protein
MTTLGALLLNPPLAGGTRTIRHVHIVAQLLQCDDVEIANLFLIATRDLTAISEAGRSGNGWEAARPRLRQVIAECDFLVAGWGVSGPTGEAGVHQRRQLGYVRARAREVGQDCIWTLGGEPRHPSRWHQYVSDRHGRASGESLGERISMVLTWTPFANLCPEESG